MTKSYTSPFISEDIGEHHPEYWLGRRKIAGGAGPRRGLYDQ